MRSLLILLPVLLQSPEIVRTGDPVKRGLSESDFPRIQALAPGVYSYEALRSAGAERFTTVSLIVVTAEGVLVADGQGSPEETKRLVEEVAKLTPVPITHVVIGSDHGDHTAGNDSFPKGVAILAHPTSKKNLAAMSPAPPAPTELVEREKALVLGGKRDPSPLPRARSHRRGSGGSPPAGEDPLHERGLPQPHLSRDALRLPLGVGRDDRARSSDGRGPLRSRPRVRRNSGDPRRGARDVSTSGGESDRRGKRLHALGLSPDDALAQADFGELETWSLHEGQAPIAIRKVYEEIEGKLP